MPHTMTAGANVSYDATGDGSPIVLVHGTGIGAAANWGHLIPALSGSHTVITPDFAGSGLTTDSGMRMNLDDLGDQVFAAAEAAAPGQNFRIAGYSLGAAVAANVAARFADRVDALALIAGWVSSVDDARAQLQFRFWQELHASDRRQLAKLMILSGFSAPFLANVTWQELEGMAAETAFTVPDGMARQAELDLRVDLRELLPSVKAPTLVVGCTRDTIVPVENARLLHESLAGSEYVEFKSGHFVMFEKAEELAGLLAAWAG